MMRRRKKPRLGEPARHVAQHAEKRVNGTTIGSPGGVLNVDSWASLWGFGSTTLLKAIWRRRSEQGDIDMIGKDTVGKSEDNQVVVISRGAVAIGGQQHLDQRAKQIGAELSGPLGTT